jgi:flagellar motor switch protein FliN/FliY
MTDSEQAARLIHHFEAALTQALSGLIGSEFTVTALDGGQAMPPMEQPCVWEQTLSLAEGPAIWIVAAKDVWESLAGLTLETAGVSDAGEDDLRSTWHEVMSQTVAGVANGLTADTLREVAASGGREADSEPGTARWIGLTAAQGAGKRWTVKAGWSPALAAALERRPGEMRTQAGKDSKVSKTFDLLLDIALPVSVSFGKTALQIREVLKLNSGSIVELNRLVSDPVEVVVNDCVIARGEVVVVDGNYGVRINQLASREDRLRSGMAEASAIAGMGR